MTPGVAALRPETNLAAGASLSRSYRVNLNVLALVALFTGGLLVFSTQAHAVVRRRAQFALLRVLGVSRHRLTGLIVAEGGGLWGSELVVRAGLTGGAFATAMVVAFAVTLRVRSGRTRSRAGRASLTHASLLVFASGLGTHVGSELRRLYLRDWIGQILAAVGAVCLVLSFVV